MFLGHSDILRAERQIEFVIDKDGKDEAVER